MDDVDIIADGMAHLQDNIFISGSKKDYLVKKYLTPFIVRDDKKTVLCLFLKNNEFSRWTSLVQLIFSRINLMRRLCKNRKPLRIWVWPTPWRKSFPSSGPFTIDNLNSGACISSKPGMNGDICIWRTEELPKVLVHELVHSFGIDREDPSPVEAYVELRAIMANAMFSLIEKNTPKAKMNTEYARLIEKEKKHGLIQARRVREIDPGKTNAIAYLDERNRLLHNVSRKEWDEMVNSVNKEHHRPRYLKFSVVDGR